MPKPQTTRFAPSPTGLLHLGHAFSALFADAQARETGGVFRLRIEDIDTTRCKPEFTGRIVEDLRWLGLSWPKPVLIQSQRLRVYRDALDRLAREGLTYPCFCTRKEILAEVDQAGGAPHSFDGPLYPGTCRHLGEAEREEKMKARPDFALRLDAAKAMATTGALTWLDRAAGKQRVDPALFGDVVLGRKDIGTSYHLSVTIDDAAEGITLVTRGRDLFPASAVHRLLQALLELPVPDWEHHDLITDDGGQRLAKRNEAETLAALREAGESAAEIRARLGY